MKITDIKTIILKYPYESFIADGQSACFGRGALLIQVDGRKDYRTGRVRNLWCLHDSYG